MIDLAVAPTYTPARARASTLTAADRRTLGGVLGFLAGLAALGPVAAVAAALLGYFVARSADSC